MTQWISRSSRDRPKGDQHVDGRTTRRTAPARCLAEAAFGQSHNSGYSGALGYRGGGGNIPADNRAHETITYDAVGRILNVLYLWERWQTSGGSTTLQTSTPFYQSSYTYDPVLALRTGASFYKAGTGGLVLDHNETYTYDANRDWLTSANYGSGSTIVSWTYL